MSNSQDPDTYTKDDNYDPNSGKTVRNFHWKMRSSKKKNEFEIRRKNPKDLTQFDIDFDIIPSESISSWQKQESFSEAEYGSAIEFLERVATSKRQNKVCTIYLVPVIGQFDKYDSKKGKFIFDTEDEHGIDYSTLDLIVEYEIWNRHDSKYFNDKNLDIHRNRWQTKNGYPEKLGRKYSRTMKSDFSEE
jgi:hypothetical protein